MKMADKQKVYKNMLNKILPIILILIFSLGYSQNNDPKKVLVTIHAEDAPLSSILAMLAGESGASSA